MPTGSRQPQVWRWIQGDDDFLCCTATKKMLYKITGRTRSQLETEGRIRIAERVDEIELALANPGHVFVRNSKGWHQI